ncbi:MAG TPA: hypothetical protein VGO03_13125 [Acidimicrobiia bacterium]
MRFTRTARRIAGVSVAAVAITGLGVGVALASMPVDSNARATGRGVNEFAMTGAYFNGHTTNFTYTRGFWCDTSVKSTASSGCEAGANYNKAPSSQHDPLYITVPLGFSVPMNMEQCPQGLICVDHPGTIDLTRLEPALKPLYPKLTDAQLTAALKDYEVPGHSHFITDANNDKPEFWDVKVIGVESPKVYADINAHKSYAYIQQLLNQHNKAVVGPIDTNLFLYFGVN